MKVLSNKLKLVYPPFTNYEGMWLWKDGEVRNYVDKSKLYMIAQREILEFYEYAFNNINGCIEFKLKMGKKISNRIKWDISHMMLSKLNKEEDIIIGEFGDKLIRLKLENEDKILAWFTPDKFIYDYWRNNIEVSIDGDFNIREFTNFDLLYVGISKENDSFSRLFGGAHHGRLNILTEQYPIKYTARVTDELIILLFDIESMGINTFENDTDITDDQIERMISGSFTDKVKIIADCEKAFVKLMDTNYNEVKFKTYPKGKDGLYNEDIDSYSYSIGEDIQLKTEKCSIKGKYDENSIGNSDSIIVKGDNIEIIKWNE